MAAHVLLTGATGFLGKVVLERLMQGQRAVRVTVLVRPKRGQNPQARLAKEIFASPCFAQCPAGWAQHVDAVEGELSRSDAGLDPEVAQRLCASVTHVVHCAASVDFDRPLAEAAQANVVSTLNVLALCRRMPRLQRLVSTSTAYVVPWREGTLPEALAPLPRPAQALWRDVQAGVDEKKLLAETGHPNTYTYTKCLAEHLLLEQRGTVPVTIVRPSIISASWRHPVPGWIDSKAAFAGFVVTIGAGLLQVIDANPNACLDLVPVDVVAERLVDATFAQGPGPATPDVDIVHAVAGTRHLAHVGQTSAAIVRYFARHRVAEPPQLTYLGARNTRFALQAMLRHKLRLALAVARARFAGDVKTLRRLQRAQRTLQTINEVFPYFTHHTFHFATRFALPRNFAVAAYVEAVCSGAAHHLLRRDPRQVRLALGGPDRQRRQASPARGRRLFAAARAPLSDAILGPRLRRAVGELSFDEASFVAAATAADLPGAAILWLPSRQGSVEAALCRQLCRARPDLHLAPPRTWRAAELGDVATEAGRQSPWRAAARRVARALGQVTDDGAPDGERSHGPLGGAPEAWVLRQPADVAGEAVWPLSPGLLRDLAHAQRPIVLIPVGVSYADARARPAPAGARVLGAVQTGGSGVHLRAGTPILLGPGTPQRAGGTQSAPSPGAAALGATLAHALESALVASPAHLAAFAATHPRTGLDAKRLQAELAGRGVRVLTGRAAATPSLADLDARAAWRARRHWQRAFGPEVRRRWPRSVALAHYFAAGPSGAPGHAEPTTDGAPPAPHGLLHALAAPVVAGALRVADAVSAARVGAPLSLAELVAASGRVPADVVAAAAAGLVAHGALLREADGATLRVVGDPDAVASFVAACTLRDDAAPTEANSATRAPATRPARPRAPAPAPTG